MKLAWGSALVACIVTIALIGCGGGGGDSNTNVSSASFPLLSGYKAYVITGSNTNFTVSGACTGTANLTSAPTTAATFEGVVGFSSADTATINLTNCTPASTAASSVEYYDTNYTPLGTSTPGEEYAKFQTTPNPLPSSVKVGDAATFGTLTIYTDSTKTVSTGTRVLSYVIEADTPSTAIVNLIAKDFDLANQLTYTQQSRYRITTNGTLTAVSVDLQYSTTHLLLTKT